MYSIFCRGFGLAALPALVSAAASAIHGHDSAQDTLKADSLEDCGRVVMSFDEFVHHHRRSYASAQEYQERKALFEERAREARDHNCRPGKKFWTAGITILSDRKAEELARLRGRKGGKAVGGQPTRGGSHPAEERLATLESKEAAVHEQGERGALPALPQEFSWSHLQAMKDIIDQGACGSCWASATVAMLRAHTDIYSVHKNFSIQQLVSCVPNPELCGGSGGCNGSTGELALDYVQHNGLDEDSAFPYHESDISCPANMVAKNLIPMPQPMSSSFLSVKRTPEASEASPAMGFGMVGWSRLPENSLSALYHALYQEGPVAVSVVAGNAWNAYVAGIMNNCTKEDHVVNHLVVLIGYGKDTAVDAKYWLIQNSWGDSWGEAGTVRMIRQDDDSEGKFCAWDKEPLIGTGCKGGPDKVWVCGSCGILYDNVVAHFTGTSATAQEMIQRKGHQYALPL